MARMKGDDQGTESGIRMRMPGVVDSALVQFHRLFFSLICSEVTSSSFRVGVAPEDSDDSEEACGMILCPAVGRKYCSES